MVQIPYADSNGTLSVEVHLKNASNVFLVDRNNFSKYKNGHTFKYFGGYYKRTPATITVNGIGRWYLIVENSDYKYKFY